MLNAFAAAVRRTPGFLRPVLILVALWLPMLLVGVSLALLADLHPSSLGIKAIMHLTAAAAVAALAYGVAGALPGVPAAVRPWFLAFVVASGFFLSMAALSSAAADTFASWHFLVVAIPGCTLAGGEVLRRFTPPPRRSP